MGATGKVKEKPASHEFRVSTDAVRAGYREKRAAASAAVLAERKQAAARMLPLATVQIPVDRGFLVCPPGAFDVAGVIAAALDTVEHVNVDEMF
jgi:hypothetical protein